MKKSLASLIRIYQFFISPLLGPHCRFVPSCSHYAMEAIEKKGIVRGLLKSAGRLVRCHPYSKGGFDPVDSERSFPIL